MDARRTAAVVGFALATAVGAQLSFDAPGSPVPITLQTVAVMAAGLFLGARDGALSQVLYILAAAIGLPVLSDGAGGLHAVTGSSLGYLVGFVLAPPACVAVVARTSRLRQGSWVVAALAGHAVVLACGAGVLVLQGTAAGRAWSGGVVPFLPGAVVKSLIAAGLVLAIGVLRPLPTHGAPSD